VKAACIDGGICDTQQILEKPFPVYHKYRVLNGSLGRCLTAHCQIPVKTGGVAVIPPPKNKS
jgi:regulator of RNase E activity RraA